jgi:rubrerythrin
MGAIPSFAMASGSVAKSDVAILNFALTLEYLEAAFYAEAVNRGNFTRETNTFARTVARHEAAHVKFLKGALGAAAVKSPTFDFKGTTVDQAKFEATAPVLEDTGVRAYLGQVGNIKSKAILAAAGSILPVEARHAAWIREIRNAKTQGVLPAATAFQAAATKAQILAAVKGTGFITG